MAVVFSHEGWRIPPCVASLCAPWVVEGGGYFRRIRPRQAAFIGPRCPCRRVKAVTVAPGRRGVRGTCGGAGCGRGPCGPARVVLKRFKKVHDPGTANVRWKPPPGKQPHHHRLRRRACRECCSAPAPRGDASGICRRRCGAPDARCRHPSRSPRTRYAATPPSLSGRKGDDLCIIRRSASRTCSDGARLPPCARKRELLLGTSRLYFSSLRNKRVQTAGGPRRTARRAAARV